MFRFFVEEEQITGDIITIYGDDVNHIRNVLRMRQGETVLISAGNEWEYTCSVQEMHEDSIVAAIEDVQRPGKELPSRISLLQCLPKGDKMELIIQKAVELGACEIVPVASKRCVMKLDKKKEASKLKRWNAIAESAAKQSKRMIIPEVKPVMTYQEAVKYGAGLDVPLIPYEKAEGMVKTREIITSIEAGMSIGVLIGPEGGFDEKEADLAMENGFKAVTLGKRILRTETAGMSMLSILGYTLEQD